MNFNANSYRLATGRYLMLWSMRILIFLCCSVIFALTPNELSSQEYVSLKKDAELSIDEVFTVIEKQTKYRFLYPEKLFENAQKVRLLKGTVSLERLLKKSLYPTYQFSVDNTTRSIKVLPNKAAQQENFVEGYVFDEFEDVLIGVTILVKGKNRGTSTDFEGYFKIKAQPTDTLQFSYIGFKSQDIPVNNQTNLGVFMKEDVSELDDVVVTAYGTTTKRLNTGNITTITADVVQQSPVGNVLQAVTANTPGLFIQQNSGQPGSSFNIQIRGQNTLNGNAQPLVVVDGVPLPLRFLPELPIDDRPLGPRDEFFDADNNRTEPYSRNDGGNGLNYINPDDIETINILKDAEATSIYGSRGANGVILITLKKGKQGKPRFNVSTRTGYNFVNNFPQLLNTTDYITYRTEALLADNADITDSEYPEVNGTYSPDKNNDYQKFFFGTPVLNTRNSVTYSGGVEKMNFLISGNYNRQRDVQNAKGVNDLMGMNFNVGVTPNDKIKVGLSGNYTYTENSVIPFYVETLTLAPNLPDFFNEDGSLNWDNFDGDSGILANPARFLNAFNDNRVHNLTANLTFTYNLGEGLDFNASLGYNNLSSYQSSGKLSTFYNPNEGNQANSSLNQYTIRSFILDPNVSYQVPWNAANSLSFKAGATLQDQFTRRSFITGAGIVSDDIIRNPTLTLRSDFINQGYTDNSSRYIGYFGMANYNYKEKYLVAAAIRYDGSTKFDEGSRFGTFGSVSAGWIFSEENWFKDALPFINFAKLRASYGTAGGDNINDFLYLKTYSLEEERYNGGLVFLPEALERNDLAWETTEKTEVGLELEFFNGRLRFSESFYNNYSTDQLIAFPLSRATGFADITRNSPAKIRNWGHELTLSSLNIESDDFTWSTNINLTLPQNELVSYPVEESLPSLNFEVGKPITGLRVYNYQGVNPETGDYNFWKDVNANGAIDDGEVATWDAFRETPDGLSLLTDRTEFVDLAPKFFGGIQNSFRYKNFDLSFLFSFTQRNVRSYLGDVLSSSFGVNNIPQRIFDSRWQNPGDITDIPRFTVEPGAQSRFENFQLSSGAFQKNVLISRLQNLNLGYNFPQTFVDNTGFTSLRMYVQGQNLLLLTNYEADTDPETGIAIPLPTSIVFGIDLGL